MARPIKDNADYFTHDADMRDDPKIKALRRKFKVAGYGVWCMLLELITDSDNFRLTIDWEIIAGDLDVDTDFLRDVIAYCIQLDLIQTDADNRVIWSKSLDNRFEPLLSKRKRERSVVIDVDNTQSKVKYSKGNIDIVGEGKFSVTIAKVYANDKIKKIHDLRLYFEREDKINDFVEKGWTFFQEFIESNPGKMFNDRDHLYNSFKNFCINYKPPERGPNPYSEAEFNKSLWTKEAWEKEYAWKLSGPRTDKNFRKYFGYGELQSGETMGGNGQH